MPLTLTSVLAIFLVGFLVNRHRSVAVAVVVAVVLGVLLANGWVGDVVHTLAGMVNSVT